jgi:hypothetical protein
VWAFQSVFKMVDGAISGATKRLAYIRNIMICNDLRVSGVVLAGCTRLTTIGPRGCTQVQP